MTGTGGVIIRVIFLNSPSLNFSARFQTVLRLICCLFSTSSGKTQWNGLWSKNNSFLFVERNEKKKKLVELKDSEITVGQRYICSVYEK